jgi:hypothetical protein
MSYHHIKYELFGSGIPGTKLDMPRLARAPRGH